MEYRALIECEVRELLAMSDRHRGSGRIRAAQWTIEDRRLAHHHAAIKGIDRAYGAKPCLLRRIDKKVVIRYIKHHVIEG